MFNFMLNVFSVTASANFRDLCHGVIGATQLVAGKDVPAHSNGPNLVVQVLSDNFQLPQGLPYSILSPDGLPGGGEERSNHEEAPV